MAKINPMPNIEDNINDGAFSNGSGTIDKHAETVNLAGCMKGALMHETGLTANITREPPSVSETMGFNLESEKKYEYRLDVKKSIETANNQINSDPLSFAGDLMNQAFIRCWYMFLNLVDVKMEQLEYKGLPDELTKSKIEKKLITNGSVAIIKHLGYLMAVNYVGEKYDIYDMPTRIRVIEPNSQFHEMKIKNANNFAIIRDNSYRIGLFNKCIFYLLVMDKAYYELGFIPSGIQDKLIFKSKVINQDGDNTMKESIIHILNSSTKVHTINDSLNTDFKTLYSVLKVTDTSQSLINVINFCKEQIKEIAGLDINTSIKMERMTTDEIGTQQGISDRILKNMINTRNEDWKVANKIFGTNISVREMEYEQDKLNQKREEKNKKAGDTNVV